MTTAGQGLRLALGILTVIPAGGGPAPSPRAWRAMVWLSGVAVLPLALGAGLISWAGHRAAAPGLLVGLLVVGWLAASTRGMHHDGLADVSDGLAGGWTPERAREVMKRGDVGPAGVVALIVALGLQASSVAALAAGPRGWLLVAAAVVLSRWSLALTCRAGWPAMPGGALGSSLVGALPRWQSNILLLVVVAAATVLPELAGIGWARGLWVGALALAVLLTLVRRAVRRFEGVNGDLMGAGIELTQTCLLVGWAW